jgi:hypothetical protein
MFASFYYCKCNPVFSLILACYCTQLCSVFYFLKMRCLCLQITIMSNEPSCRSSGALSISQVRILFEQCFIACFFSTGKE